MACESNTAAAWERHGMYELAFRELQELCVMEGSQMTQFAFCGERLFVWYEDVVSCTTVLRLYRYDAVPLIRNIFVLFSTTLSSDMLKLQGVNRVVNVNHHCHEASTSPNVTQSPAWLVPLPYQADSYLYPDLCIERGCFMILRLRSFQFSAL
jgi:hypothetical protein